ncbi:MAG: sugar ABC transporter ATP-binding protein [Alphaproteobacteria bacterium]|nr:sugar ABC transporter ATP-binding protein [Alphaproteobacteria bacterium]
MRAVTKRFPGVVANDAVDLVVKCGEIHGLLGENGSGKSTVIKTLTGVHQPDAGQILRDGTPVSISSPVVARELGVAAVFQEFSLVPSLSVAENIHLGRLPVKAGRVDWQAMRDNARAVLARLRVDIDPDAIVGSLSVASQQLVEIAKAIAANASLFILDEPTAALGQDEIAELHRVVREIKANGAAVLYISHRLDEVAELVDCVTVLKDGKVAARAGETEVNVEAIVGAMVGNVGDHYPKVVATPGETALEVTKLSNGGKVVDVSFAVRRGEVFGLGGVLGSGRTDIARIIFGLDPVVSGEILIHGKKVRLNSPADAIAAGIAYVPENRKFDGLFFNFAGIENMSVAAFGRFTRNGLLDLTAERSLTRELISRLAITPAAEERLVGLLSGGNQQKIVIARWLFARADILLLDEPTQGIDIGAKIGAYNLINELAAEGKSIVLISSDHDELIAMSDRIGIVSNGRLVETKPAAMTSKTDLVRAATAGETRQ